MDKSHIESFVFDFIDSDNNKIPLSSAHEPKLAGLKMYDEPLFAYGDAFDKRFVELKDNPEAKVPLMPPCEWLPSAQSVISCFLPISADIRKSNRQGTEPSWGWLHARFEGNTEIFALAKRLCNFIDQDGYESLSPVQDERFFYKLASDAHEPYVTNWSERHVGFLCGLGTFSLAKHLITEKGAAGRIFSVITSLKLEPTVPKYSGLLDYCIDCRACVKNCPVGAIDQYHLKDDRLCLGKLDEVLERNPPYYGCGKCQVGVPCENKVPKKR